MSQPELTDAERQVIEKFGPAWFGKHWGAPICEHSPQVATPVGELCSRCEEPIQADDNGMMVPSSLGLKPWHLECHLRSLVGGVNHQRRLCKCFGGSLDPDPPGLSIHEAAKLAAREYFGEAS